MNESTLLRTSAFTIAGYPLYLAKTLVQIGYEPVRPNHDGSLPNIFTYISIIRREKGYISLYTGLRYYLPMAVLKDCTHDFLSSLARQKNLREKEDLSDPSEIVATCLRESAFKIHSTLVTYPLLTLCVGYISSTFFGSKEAVEYTWEALYKGVVPKLIIEVTMVWVSIISKRIATQVVDDQLTQAIVSRIPPFIVQTLMYPLSVVSTVMADNGRSRLNPKFDDWRECYRYLQAGNQLKRGSSLFFRYQYRPISL